MPIVVEKSIQTKDSLDFEKTFFKNIISDAQVIDSSSFGFVMIVAIDSHVSMERFF